MKKMKLYEADDQMITLICDNYNVLQALGAFGISLGFGNKTVREVCEQQRVDTYTFITVINFIINGYRSPNCEEHLSVLTLMQYLKASHEYFLHFQLPNIRKELSESISADAKMSKLILQLYDNYSRTIQQHMKYEEKTLFPYVEALLRGEKKPDYNIDTFSRHHGDTTSKLMELKNIIIQYLPADGLSNNKLTATLYSLYNNEEWLRIHATVEDEIFTPAIRHLESKTAVDDVTSRISSLINMKEDSCYILSDREKEVIVCLVQGMSNKEIADKLYISVYTVMTHRRNISRKLNIHSSAGLTIYAIVNNLIDISKVKDR